MGWIPYFLFSIKCVKLEKKIARTTGHKQGHWWFRNLSHVNHFTAKICAQDVWLWTECLTELAFVRNTMYLDALTLFKS